MIPKTRAYIFPLKRTSKVDIIGRIANYFGENYEKILIICRPILKQMQENRDALDFAKFNQFFETDPSQLDMSEYYIINYLRFVYYLDNYFSRDFDSNSNIITFPWTDSFNPSKSSKTIGHIKYELLCVLYNLAMTNLADGVTRIMVPYDEDVKNGIEKLSIALWALEDIKTIQTILPFDTRGINDLDEEYIKFLIEYIQCIIYSAWTQNLSDTIDYSYQAAAHINASKKFRSAYDQFLNIKYNPLPDKEFAKLKIKLFFNHHMHAATAHYYMAMAIEINPDKMPLDKAYASEYLDRAIACTEEILKTKDELEELEPEETEEIFVMQETIGKLMKKYPPNHKMNISDIPDFPDFYNVPRPLKPKDLYTRINDENKLESILPEEVKAIKADFDYKIALEASGVESLLDKLRTVKNKKFAQYQVDSLASLETQAQSSSKVNIPESLKQKIATFRKNGGYDGFKKMRKNVAELIDTCKYGLNELRSIVAKDKVEDEKLLKTHGDKYNPNTICEEAYLISNAKVLEQKFLQAQESDSNFNKLVERYENWMERFSGSDEDILELILLNSDSQFLSKNQKVIIEVSKLNKDFLNKISKIPNDLKKINDAFKRNDFYTSFVRIANNLVNKDDEFDKLMGEYINELEKIRDLISECYPTVDMIAGRASEIVSTGAKTPLKILTEMNEAIDQINKLNEDLNTQTFYFYNELLKRIVETKENLPEALVQKNKARQKFLADNPYFQEEFPMGKSIFMFKPPENKEEEPQGGMIESLVIQRAGK